MIAGSYLRCSRLPFYLQIFNEGSREAKGAWTDLASAHAVGSVAGEKSNRPRYPGSTSGTGIVPFSRMTSRVQGVCPQNRRKMGGFLNGRVENSPCSIPFFAIRTVPTAGS